MKKRYKIQIINISILFVAVLMLSSCSTRQAFSIVMNERTVGTDIQKTSLDIDRKALAAKQPRPGLFDIEDDDDMDDPDMTWEELPMDELDGPALSQVQEVLMREYSAWKGTPYRFGGNTMRGIDCSGFVKHMYTALFSLNVPRSSREFANVGHRIHKDELQPGDLIVFSRRTTPSHVGIYIGNNKFIHSSRNKGVSMADLDQRYWKRAYLMARRLIQP